MYKTVDLFFKKNPGTKRIPSLKEKDAVLREMKHIVMANFFDRPFSPWKCGNIFETLGKNITPMTMFEVKKKIEQAIVTYCTNVFLIGVLIERSGNAIAVSIVYRIKTSNKTETVSFYIK